MGGLRPQNSYEWFTRFFIFVIALASFVLWIFSLVAATGIEKTNKGYTDPFAISIFAVVIAVLSLVIWIPTLAWGAYRRTGSMRVTWQSVWFFWILLLLFIVAIFGFILERRFGDGGGIFGAGCPDDDPMVKCSNNPIVPSPYDANQMQRYIEWKALLISIIIITSIIIYSVFDLWQDYDMYYAEKTQGGVVNAAIRSKTPNKRTNKSLF